MPHNFTRRVSAGANLSNNFSSRSAMFFFLINGYRAFAWLMPCERTRVYNETRSERRLLVLTSLNDVRVFFSVRLCSVRQ